MAGGGQTRSREISELVFMAHWFLSLCVGWSRVGKQYCRESSGPCSPPSITYCGPHRFLSRLLHFQGSSMNFDSVGLMSVSFSHHIRWAPIPSSLEIRKPLFFPFPVKMWSHVSVHTSHSFFSDYCSHKMQPWPAWFVSWDSLLPMNGNNWVAVGGGLGWASTHRQLISGLTF